MGGPLLTIGLPALVGIRTSILLSIIPRLLAALAIAAAIRSAPQLAVGLHQPIRLRVHPVLTDAWAGSSSRFPPSSSARSPRRF
jgi:hypothetical protein